GLRDTAVERPRNDPNARIPGGEFAGDRETSVWTCIVDDQDFDGRIGLRQTALQGLPQKPLASIARHNNRNQPCNAPRRPTASWRADFHSASMAGTTD